MHIELATLPDKPAIEQLLAAENLPTDDLNDALLSGFFVAREGTSLCGTVAIEKLGSAVLLRSLAVKPECRGRGLGQQLVARAETAARDSGVDGIYLLTTTARDFFARLGYRVATREEAPPAIAGSTEFRSLCPASAVFMAKR